MVAKCPWTRIKRLQDFLPTDFDAPAAAAAPSSGFLAQATPAPNTTHAGHTRYALYCCIFHCSIHHYSHLNKTRSETIAIGIIFDESGGAAGHHFWYQNHHQGAGHPHYRHHHHHHSDPLAAASAAAAAAAVASSTSHGGATSSLFGVGRVTNSILFF